MKSSLLIAGAAVFVAALSSCQPMSNQNATGTGAAVGATGGAILGALAGNQSGQAEEGAVVGAIGGAAVGAQNGPRWFGGDGTIKKVEREDGSR